jgi:hypothetical protein
MTPVLIPASLPPRTKKAGNFKIYLDPRISANHLAQFIVSDHTKQETIVRNAKRMSKICVANYQPARAAVARSHDGHGLSVERLSAEADRMEIVPLEKTFESDCEKLSAAALRKLIALAPMIDCPGVQIRRPARSFDHLMIENVRVSVQPEIVLSMAHLGATRFGGVLVNFSKNEALSKASGKYKAGDYVAFLVFQMLALHFGAEGGPRYAKCFAVDVYREEIYSAPASHISMLKNVQAACRSIARQWDEEPGDDENSPPGGEIFF